MRVVKERATTRPTRYGRQLARESMRQTYVNNGWKYPNHAQMAYYRTPAAAKAIAAGGGAFVVGYAAGKGFAALARLRAAKKLGGKGKASRNRQTLRDSQGRFAGSK
jgi:hypothetical protein